MYSLELFCGTGRLTAAIRKLGLNDSVGIDNVAHKHLTCPSLKLDLTTDECLTLVENMLAQDRLAYIHMAPPCGTSSRARLIRRKGRYNPPPARSDRFPDGLPSLQGSLRARVDAANRLYSFCGYIFKRCIDLGILVSVENPGRSFMWQTSFWKQHVEFDAYHTLFHHCCYGSQRRKLTRLVHTLEKLTSMCAKCPGESETHKHLAWGMSDRMWATAEETAYPVRLCKTWAGLVLDQLLALGGIAPAASLADRTGRDHRAAQAVLGHQAKSKRLPPLVKEFKDIFYMVCNPQQMPPNKVTVQTPIDAECDHNFPKSLIPAGSRIVRTQILGVKKTSASNVSNDEQDDIPLQEDCGDHGVSNQIKVFMGVPWTPKEFIEQASNLQHPKHIVQSLDMFLKEVIYNNANTDFLHIGRDRINAMRKWTAKAKELEDVEKEVKAKLPEHCFEVLRHKRLSLFQDMLNDIGYDDKSIASEMCVGFKLAGPIPPSPVFKKKRTSATLSVNDLRHSAHVTRQGIILSTVSSGDDELDRALQAVTDKELEKGWLWGPIDVSSLPETACVSRRFGIWQGGKCRPIDNLKESGINATTSAADTITVHTADYTAAGISYKMSCGTTDELSIKTWDLRKAYKNLPVHLESLNDNYLSVFHPGEGSARVYGQRVLPFGSRASVHGFVRVAVALWTLAVKIFRIHWSVYFDDFICVEYSSLSRLTDMCICNFFNLLGWETSDDKDSVFSSVAKFLGLEIDLSSVRLGCFTMQNTKKRRTEIADSIDAILKSGKLPRKEAASLRGRLIFAECQIAGRSAGSAFHILTQHLLSGKTAIDDEVKQALTFLKGRLTGGIPRTISLCLGEVVHIYVDASFEPHGRYPAGIGGVLILSGSTPFRYFGETIDSSLLDVLNEAKSEHPIYELECFAIFSAIQLWHNFIKHRHVVIFTDNDGSLGAMIKGFSSNPTGMKIVRNANTLLDEGCSICWFERVNTCSNIADEPSRIPICSGLGDREDVNLKSLVEHAIK